MQRACDFTDAGCCAKCSGLTGIITASGEANKSPFAVCKMPDLPEKLQSEPSL